MQDIESPRRGRRQCLCCRSASLIIAGLNRLPRCRSPSALSQEDETCNAFEPQYWHPDGRLLRVS
eukprot:40283-Eustigmatos_ZCMA.PRE.1